MKNISELRDDKHEWSITTEEIKRSKGLELISDEEAAEIAETLVKLAIIALEGSITSPNNNDQK